MGFHGLGNRVGPLGRGRWGGQGYVARSKGGLFFLLICFLLPLMGGRYTSSRFGCSLGFAVLCWMHMHNISRPRPLTDRADFVVLYTKKPKCELVVLILDEIPLCFTHVKDADKHDNKQQRKTTSSNFFIPNIEFPSSSLCSTLVEPRALMMPYPPPLLNSLNGKDSCSPSASQQGPGPSQTKTNRVSSHTSRVSPQHIKGQKRNIPPKTPSQ